MRAIGTRVVVGILTCASGVAFSSAAAADEGDARVVVGFKGKADADFLAKRGVAVEDVHGRWAVGTVAAGGIAALRAEADVAYVEEDVIAEALGKPGGGAAPAQSTPWGVTKVWGGSAPSVTGSGIKVAIIDTGIDLGHADLKANIGGNVTFVSRTTSGKDDNGHGSHVAGTVAAVNDTIGVVGVAPKAKVYAVKVLDKRGNGYLSDVALGIDWAVANGMHVANMSLGASSGTTTLSTACSLAEAAGVLLIAASGNSGDGSTSTNETSYPAAYASVVSVGATSSTDALASFSNTNSDVELSGPGVSVYSTYKGGGYSTLSGTSMASPHAAGVAALIWQELGSTTASAVRTALQSRARDVGTTGRDAGFGYGVVSYPAP